MKKHLLKEIIKIPIVLFLILLATTFILFTIFSHFRVSENPVQDFIAEQGSLTTAYIKWFTGFIAGEHFEFRINSYIAGKGTFLKHAMMTFKLMAGAFIVNFLISTILILWNKSRLRQKNLISTMLKVFSSVHTLIFIIVAQLLLGAAHRNFWIFVFIIAISSNMFKEFYGDYTAEIRRIYNEHYVQRAFAWGRSAIKYALPELLISLSRLFCAKLPLFLSSSFIIEYWSPKYTGLANDLLIGVQKQDYFLLLSITAVFITLISIFYQLGRLPRFIDPRMR